MKNIFILAVLMVFTGIASAAMAGDSPSKNGRFVGGVGLGGAIPVDGFGSAYSAGGGVDGNLGFQLDENWALLLEIDSYIFQTNLSGVYAAEVNLLPSVKWALGTSSTKFYLLAGLGENVNQLYIKSGSETVTLSEKNFAIGPGLGIQFPLNDALDLYLQAKFIDVFAASSFSYIPLAVGLDFM